MLISAWSAAFEIGSAYLRHDPLERLARPLLVQLVHEVGQTAHLGVERRQLADQQVEDVH